MTQLLCQNYQPNLCKDAKNISKDNCETYGGSWSENTCTNYNPYMITTEEACSKSSGQWMGASETYVCLLDSPPSTETECQYLQGQWLSDIEKCYFDPFSLSRTECESKNVGGQYVYADSVIPETGAVCGYSGTTPPKETTAEIQCCTKKGQLCSAGIYASAPPSGVTIGKVGYSSTGLDQFVCNIPSQE